MPDSADVEGDALVELPRLEKGRGRGQYLSDICTERGHYQLATRGGHVHVTYAQRGEEGVRQLLTRGREVAWIWH